MRAGDVMTQRVVSVAADASILQAAELMLQNKISGLPVVDADGKLVGVVTERDFLRRAGAERIRPRWFEVVIGPKRLADEYARSHARTVEQVMTAHPITVSDDAPLEDVLRLMEEHKIKRLPIVHEGRLVGIISRSDLLRALVHFIRWTSASGRDDAAVSARLTDLERAFWTHRTKPFPH